jgi:hypothetical protein
VDREDVEAMEAERGYSVRSTREVRLREWFSLREEGEAPGDFKRLVDVLRAKKWAKANPERYLEIHRLSDRRHRSEALVRVKNWRHARIRSLVFTCASRECDVQWCRVPGGQLRGNKRPIYCSSACFNREGYLRSRDRRKTMPAK